MLTVYTHSSNPAHKEFWKSLASKVLQKYSGPKAVRDSLLRGLQENNIEYELNPIKPHGDTVLVLSGIEALTKAILFKENGIIKKLIAGPNIVIAPHDSSNLMLSDAIDKILVPSEWVAGFWKYEAPEITEKIYVWASGVAKAKKSIRSSSPIIYNKIQNKEILNMANEVIKSTGKIPKIFTYGTYKHSEYLEYLSNTPYLVYIAHSESQGLSLQEAWAHDVPTFVNKSSTWHSGTYSAQAQQINAPYLTNELGGVFSNESDLNLLIDKLGMFHPKQYCDKHLSDSISVKTILALI